MSGITPNNLGWVKSVFKGITPPSNTDMLWFDNNVDVKKHKYYDTVSSTWKLFQNVLFYSNLASFPAVGAVDFIYVDKGGKIIYIYDLIVGYVSVGGGGTSTTTESDVALVSDYDSVGVGIGNSQADFNLQVDGFVGGTNSFIQNQTNQNQTFTTNIGNKVDKSNTEKTTIVDNDTVIGNDSEASENIKKWKFSTIKTWIKGFLAKEDVSGLKIADSPEFADLKITTLASNVVFGNTAKSVLSAINSIFTVVVGKVSKNLSEYADSSTITDNASLLGFWDTTNSSFKKITWANFVIFLKRLFVSIEDETIFFKPDASTLDYAIISRNYAYFIPTIPSGFSIKYENLTAYVANTNVAANTRLYVYASVFPSTCELTLNRQ